MSAPAMDFHNASSFSELVSPTTEGEVLQVFRSHSRETRLSSRLSLLALIVACSVIVFLVSSCASRLSLTGTRTTRRLAESGEEESPLLGACSNDPEGTSESEEPPPTTSSAAASQGSSNPESSRRHHYDFRRIDGEHNRRTLQAFMSGIYMWRLPHPGLFTRKCTIQLGNIVLRVKAEELDIWEASQQLEEFILRTKEELFSAGAQFDNISNGFLVKEEGRPGRGGRFQILVDAGWAESPAPLGDFAEDEDDEGGASPPQPQPPGAQPGEEAPPPQPRYPRDPELFAYEFSGIPGQDNRKALQAVMGTFYSMSSLHFGKKRRRRVVEMEDLYILVQVKELQKGLMWPRSPVVKETAIQLENEIFLARDDYRRHGSGLYVKRAFDVDQTGPLPFHGKAEFLVKVYQKRKPIVDSGAGSGASRPRAVVTRRPAPNVPGGNEAAAAPSTAGASGP